MEYRGAGLSKNLSEEPWSYYNQARYLQGGQKGHGFFRRCYRLGSSGMLHSSASLVRHKPRLQSCTEYFSKQTGAAASLPCSMQAEAVLMLADALNTPQLPFAGS